MFNTMSQQPEMNVNQCATFDGLGLRVDLKHVHVDRGLPSTMSKKKISPAEHRNMTTQFKVL